MDSEALPETPSQWLKRAGAVSAKSIYDLPPFQYGVDIDIEQYLYLRVLWKSSPESTFSEESVRQKWLLDKHYETISRSLSSELVDWSGYLAFIGLKQSKGTSSAFPAGLGILALVGDRQSKLGSMSYSNDIWIPKLSSSTLVNAQSTGAYVASNDEENVLLALVWFLDAITSLPGFYFRWMQSRKEFRCMDWENRGYRALVDGYLCTFDDNVPLVILEVKPCSRKNNSSTLRKQEAAQMAAWISSCPYSKYEDREAGKPITRLLISQDDDEVYLTFATFTAAYIQYTQGLKLAGGEADTTFLEMNEYGPFSVHNRDHVEKLAWYVLSYLRQLQEKGT